MQHFERIHVGHLDIEKHDIGKHLVNHLDSLRTGAGLAQDLYLGRERFQQLHHTLACKRFIINH